MASETETGAVPPALTAEEWRTSLWEVAALRSGDRSQGSRDHAREMALRNAALPDGDPRKLTWAMVDALRVVGHAAENDGADGTAAFTAADVLAALLPPREEG